MDRFGVVLDFIHSFIDLGDLVDEHLSLVFRLDIDQLLQHQDILLPELGKEAYQVNFVVVRPPYDALLAAQFLAGFAIVDQLALIEVHLDL